MPNKENPDEISGLARIADEIDAIEESTAGRRDAMANVISSM